MACPPAYALFSFALLSIGSFAPALPPATTTTVRQIAPGVTFTQEIAAGPEPLIVHVLRVDRRIEGVRVQAAQARDVVSYGGSAQGRETVRSMADRSGAIAAINGDYFPYNGDPTSLEIRNGELISEPIGYRAAVGLTRTATLFQVLTSHGVARLADRTELLLNGINHLPHDGETVLLTATYDVAAAPNMKQPAQVVTLTGVPLPFRVSRDLAGTVDSVVAVAAGQPLPPCPRECVQIVAVGTASPLLAARCTVGDPLTVRYDLLPLAAKQTPGAGVPDTGPPTWQEVEQAIGGGPWLVRDGRIFVDGEAERQSLPDFVNARHPRTAIGVTAEGALLLVAVDGRKAISRGATLLEMAGIMKRYGAQQAINLDGGGSTELVLAGQIVNTPSDGKERPVANGLLVFAATPPATEQAELRITAARAPALTVQAGARLQLNVVDAADAPVRTPILWGTQDGRGFVDQSGVFQSANAGTVMVLARIGNTRITATITVLPAPTPPGGTPPALQKPVSAPGGPSGSAP
jgi:hypothetical protein